MNNKIIKRYSFGRGHKVFCNYGRSVQVCVDLANRRSVYDWAALVELSYDQPYGETTIAHIGDFHVAREDD